MMSITLSSFGIATITPTLLHKFNAMQHYTLTSLMTSCVMLLFFPIVGKITDTVGRRPMLIIGSVMFVISSFAAGFMTNFPLFIVARALIAIGGTCLMPLSSATLPFVFERNKLPQLYGIQGAFLALGTFFGSTMAGFLSDRGIAWLAVAYPGILGGLGAIIMFFLCPDIPRKPLPSIDFGGIALMFCIVIPTMYVVSFGSRVGWLSPLIVGALILIGGAIAAFIVVEKKVRSPLIDLKLFGNPIFTGVLLCTFFMTWYQSSMRVYIPLVIQNVMGMSAAVSGSVLLPRSILNILLPTFCGAWIAKKLSARCWKGILIAGLTIAIGNGMLGFLSPTTTMAVFFIGLGFTGIAESFKQAAVTPVLQGILTSENMGSGVSLNGMIGALGSAISACLFGVIFDSIAPDVSILPDLTRAGRVVFTVAAATGLVVSLLAFFLLRPKKGEEL